MPPHKPFRIRRTDVVAADGTRAPAWYWALIALNGETLAHSELYTRKESAVAGVRAAIAAVVTLDAVFPPDLVDDETTPEGRP